MLSTTQTIDPQVYAASISKAVQKVVANLLENKVGTMNQERIRQECIRVAPQFNVGIERLTLIVGSPADLHASHLTFKKDASERMKPQKRYNPIQ